MSPRAAVRLLALGFDRVFDYVDGKEDWIAAGLPLEGERAGETRALGLARREVPTCHTHETVEGLRSGGRIDETGVCVVIDHDRVVHGLLTADIMATAEPSRSAEEVMELGPATIRPTASPRATLDRMESAGERSILVTTEFGELLGVLYRDDVQSHIDKDSQD